jgi:Ca2+-transporting ATPase
VPLTSHQILAMNLITDVLPALGIVLQQPEHHHLATLAREGTSALEAPLRHEVFGRSAATAGPSLAAYLLALRSGTPLARTIAYTTIITTQLAQTLDAGRTRGGRSRSVQGVVAGSAGLLAGTLAIQPVRKFLGLVPPTPFGWVLVGAATGTAVMLGRTLASPGPAEPGLA